MVYVYCIASCPYLQYKCEVMLNVPQLITTKLLIFKNERTHKLDENATITITEVCKLLCMETLEQRRIMLCITFVKRSLKQHPDLFPTVHHSRETRFSHQGHLIVPNSKSKRFQNSARLFLPKLYNSHLKRKSHKHDDKFTTW